MNQDTDTTKLYLWWGMQIRTRFFICFRFWVQTILTLSPCSRSKHNWKYKFFNNCPVGNTVYTGLDGKIGEVKYIFKAESIGIEPVFRIRIRNRIKFVSWIRIRTPNADPDPAADKFSSKSQNNSYHLELLD